MDNYKLTSDPNTILRLSDNAVFGAVEASTDYQEYLAWLAVGNEPLPADEPEQSEEN